MPRTRFPGPSGQQPYRGRGSKTAYLIRYHPKMRIDSDLLDAYLKCPTKCWLRATAEPLSCGSYAEWAKTQNDSYRVIATQWLVAQCSTAEIVYSPDLNGFKPAKRRLALGLAVRAQMDCCSLESEVHALECLPAKGRATHAQFVPVRFAFANKLCSRDKMALAYDAFALSRSLRCEITRGKIIHGDEYIASGVNTAALTKEVRECVEKIASMLSNSSPPELVLNRHCPECEFQTRCRKLAIEKDDLSLLESLTEKERKKLHSKGIFTVTQLSYTFRPRKRSRRSANRIDHCHSLKALAIR